MVTVKDESFVKLLQSLEVLPAKMLKNAQQRIDSDLESTFAAQQDPNAQPWPSRLHEPKDGHALLDDTGTLRQSRSVTISTDGELVISYDAPYAGYVNDGSESNAPRQLLPDDRRALPEKWSAIIDDAITDLLKDT